MLGDVGVDAERNRLDLPRPGRARRRSARLEAEQALAAGPALPGDLLSRRRQARCPRREAIAKEQALFQARRDALGSETALLRRSASASTRRSRRCASRSRRWRARWTCRRASSTAAQAAQGRLHLAPMRIVQLEAMVVDYASKLEERRSELARADQRLGRQSICEIKALHNDVRQGGERPAQGRPPRASSEIEQELRKSEDAAARQVVAAPGRAARSSTSSSPRPARWCAPASRSPTSSRATPTWCSRPTSGRKTSATCAWTSRARVKFTAFKYRNTRMVTGQGELRLRRPPDRQGQQPAVLQRDDHRRRAVAAGARASSSCRPACRPRSTSKGRQQTPLQYLAEPITSTIRKARRPL